MENTHFERDIYPAISSGEFRRIEDAVSKLVLVASASNTDADILIRSMNWTWPSLTSKARTNSEEGRVILSKFCQLLTKLVSNCSDTLLATVAGLKQLIRCVVRGLKSLDPSVSSEYLRCLSTRLLEDANILKSVKGGFFFDRAALENIISIRESTEDEELSNLAENVLTRVLKSRVLYPQDVVVEFLVKITKALNGSAASSRLVSVVLQQHKSRDMYNTFMDKVQFLSPSSSASTMTRITNLNFFIDVVSAKCPGDRFPSAITKSELTACILNHKKNGLISIFSIRLISIILTRLGSDFELRTKPETVVNIRDKLVELGSLLPVLQHYLSDSSSRSLLFVYEILKLVLAYKRALPGSFSDYKFSWTKLLDSKTSAEKLSILSRFISDLVASHVPITLSTIEAVAKISDKSLVERFCRTSKIVSSCFGDAIDAWLRVFDKESILVESVSFILSELVKNPTRLAGDDPVVSQIARLESCPFAHLVSKVEKRMKRKRTSLEDETSTEKRVAVLPSSLPYYACARGAMQSLADCMNISGPKCTVNLIELVGVKVDLFFATIMSLSSPNSEERDSAFQILAVVLRALALSIEAKASGKFTFREAPQIAMILTWLRNGIAEPDIGSVPMVPRRICVFVVESIKILLNPKHDLYKIVYKFILAKPAVKLTSNPLWSSLFFSTNSSTCRAERLWIMDQMVEAEEESVVVDMMAAGLHLNATEDEFDRALRYMAKMVKKIEGKFAICNWLSLVLRHARFLR